MGGYERDPGAVGAGRRARRTSRRSCCPRTGSASTRSLGNSIRRVPAMETAGVRKLFNGPEAFTPDGEFILGESDVPRLLGGRRLLRARPGRRRRDRLADGRMDRQRRAQPRPLAHGHPPLRRASTAARPTRWRAPSRSTPPTTTSTTRTTSARPGGRCGSRRPTRGWPSWAPRSARSRAGSGPTGSSRTPPRATSRCDRAAGRAALVAGHRRRGMATRERAGAVRRELVRQVRGARAGRAGAAAAAVRQRCRPRASARSPTRRC